MTYIHPREFDHEELNERYAVNHIIENKKAEDRMEKAQKNWNDPVVRIVKRPCTSPQEGVG